MSAIGYLEGWLSSQAIFDHWLAEQDQWQRAQIQAHAGRAGTGSNSQHFWDMQALIMHQVSCWAAVDGMVRGYNARVTSRGAEQAAALPSSGSRRTLSLRSQGPGGSHHHLLQPSQGEAAGQPFTLPGSHCAADGSATLPLTTLDFLLLNAFGDVDDLLPLVQRQAEQLSSPEGAGSSGGELHPAWTSHPPAKLRARLAKQGHCSALVKVRPDLRDLLVGHATWWSYSSLLRIYKHYTTALHHPAVSAQRLSFSSYPGLVNSVDDFYILGSGLVITETSNDVFNLAAYDRSSNQAALSWHRARAACMLANNGSAWATLATMHNSGTYNCQYMVVDLKRFQPGEELQSGLLTIVETMPGGSAWADTTQELERGYWPSYNVPYFPEIYAGMGYPHVRAALRKRGQAFDSLVAGLSYQVCSRAKLLRRDAGNVTNLAELKRLLRSNGWRADPQRSDPFSPSPWEALSARGDLDPQEPDASGAYDA
ncbi:hypothetical protein QJQ45_016659, partial [Haematococcus lacustris]